ncbi:hypothetical protein B0H14DRAFT_2619262 [Mycena olivaceomarginata]|nr:hypothetical protein B0H14DRAFT_2619262 [Mycena olivaceomarginata]
MSDFKGLPAFLTTPLGHLYRGADRMRICAQTLQRDSTVKYATFEKQYDLYITYFVPRHLRPPTEFVCADRAKQMRMKLEADIRESIGPAMLNPRAISSAHAFYRASLRLSDNAQIISTVESFMSGTSSGTATGTGTLKRIQITNWQQRRRYEEFLNGETAFIAWAASKLEVSNPPTALSYANFTIPWRSRSYNGQKKLRPFRFTSLTFVQDFVIVDVKPAVASGKNKNTGVMDLAPDKRSANSDTPKAWDLDQTMSESIADTPRASILVQKGDSEVSLPISPAVARWRRIYRPDLRSDGRNPLSPNSFGLDIEISAQTGQPNDDFSYFRAMYRNSGLNKLFIH